MSLEEQALAYLKRGWSVVPIQPNGKMPLIKWAGLQKKAATEKEVHAWFEKWPDANLGVITGAVSGVMVIDIDPRNGGSLDVVGRTVETDLVSATPGGGVHLWCKHPGRGTKLLVKPDEYEGVDIQGDGRLVVVPPSVRPEGDYSWVREGELGVAPPWVFASDRRRKDEENEQFSFKPDWIASTLKGVAPGQRHTALTRLCGYFLKQDMPLDICLGLLHAWNQKNSEPIPAAEIEKTARSLYTLHGGDSEGKVGPARWFDKKGKFIPSIMGDTLRDEQPMVTIHGELHVYHNGVYRNGEEYISGKVAVQLGKQFSTVRVNEVVSYLRLSSKRTIGEQDDFSHINCQNGLVNARTGEFTIHTPDYVSFNQIPVDWVPDAECPKIDKFINEVMQPDCCDLFYEITGYCVYPDLPFREALVMSGPSATGKSVLLGVLRELIGRFNYSTVPVHSLADEKFHRAELVNKLANICGDLDSSTIRGAGIFKQITGGDSLMAERKGQNPFTFRNRATMLFSANAPPRGGDRSDAWYTRWIVLPMTKKVPRHKQDPYLLEKLTTKEELEGLLVRGVTALAGLLKRGRFELPKSVEEENLEYRERTDPLASWVGDKLDFDIEARCKRADLYESFKMHAQDAGFYAIPPAHEIYRRLRLEYNIDFSRSKGTWKARGVSIKEIQVSFEED